jgi:GH15 family glucan-1,4-alpha-glucosidase
MNLADLGLIGNCQCSALIDRSGSVVWSCLPRFDSEPVFGHLLDPNDGGSFAIGSSSGSLGAQEYLSNTNVLVTRFEDADGSFRIIDFFPRFRVHERSFRPTKLVRIVEPLDGSPRIRVRCDPRLGWSKARTKIEVGSHHVSYGGYEVELRLTTDVPLSYLDGRPFALTERRHFVLAWGAPVEEPLPPLCDRFLGETTGYWRKWVKRCNVPPWYQEPVIRSALALKLHCFEDTGAIVAALTTSLPESPGSGRTWDYRYCWLRDAYYALAAFRLLGHFEEREQFIHFLLNIAGSAPSLALAPLYRIDGGTDLTESTWPDWPGYRNEGPVRTGNAAALHRQNDVFGEMVLALSPIFLDARFRDQQTPAVLHLLTALTRKAISVAGQPDAGIWEYRENWRPQTFSTLMCWAAAERMSQVCVTQRLQLGEEFKRASTRLRDEILTNAVDTERNCLVATYGEKSVDAALLQAIMLRLLPPSDPRLIGTVSAIRKDLQRGDWIQRYATDDGFGVPQVAFVICAFWLVEALARTGQIEQARELMRSIENVQSPLGLLAEDIDPVTGEMWGNFPQAYSHVGLIHAAFGASPSWSETT